MWSKLINFMLPNYYRFYYWLTVVLYWIKLLISGYNLVRLLIANNNSQNRPVVQRTFSANQKACSSLDMSRGCRRRSTHKDKLKDKGLSSIYIDYVWSLTSVFNLSAVKTWNLHFRAFAGLRGVNLHRKTVRDPSLLKFIVCITCGEI